MTRCSHCGSAFVFMEEDNLAGPALTCGSCARRTYLTPAPSVDGWRQAWPQGRMRRGPKPHTA